MKYALNLSEDSRILSVWVVLPNGQYDGMPIVDSLPDGNLTDYLYVDGKYVYDPLPEPEPEKPVPTEAERIAQLEEENRTLTAQVDALSFQLDFQEECLVEMAGIIYA